MSQTSTVFGLPHLTFPLRRVGRNHKLRETLSGRGGIYELRLPGDPIIVTRKPLQTSRTLYIGRSRDLLNRLSQYAIASVADPLFHQVLLAEPVRCAVWFSGTRDARAAEALAIYEHARKTGRIPMFNMRGEFQALERFFGVRLPPSVQERFRSAWYGQSRGNIYVKKR